jgi:hypothetical protein
MTPIPFHPIHIFDQTKHQIDIVATEYLQKATDDVRHLVPVNVDGDGNCLYHSMVLLINNPSITATELRGMHIVFVLLSLNYFCEIIFSTNNHRTCNK